MNNINNVETLLLDTFKDYREEPTYALYLLDALKELNKYKINPNLEHLNNIKYNIKLLNDESSNYVKDIYDSIDILEKEYNNINLSFDL